MGAVDGSGDPNPELNDRVPIRPIREESLEIVGPEIIRAVRSFVAGG
jgi:hypothetical protein